MWLCTKRTAHKLITLDGCGHTNFGNDRPPMRMQKYLLNRLAFATTLRNNKLLLKTTRVSCKETHKIQGAL